MRVDKDAFRVTVVFMVAVDVCRQAITPNQSFEQLPPPPGL
jgi:hypothetical protein